MYIMASKLKTNHAEIKPVSQKGLKQVKLSFCETLPSSKCCKSSQHLLTTSWYVPPYCSSLSGPTKEL